MANKYTKQSGFALLLTLLVVTVLISIGVAVLNLSVKQVRLATNAKDSEVAFHAANAGLECGLYHRRAASSTMEVGGNILPIGCFGQVLQPSSYQYSRITSGVTGGDVHRYQYEFTWGSPERCTQIDTLVGVADINQSDLVISNINADTLIPGFPDSSKRCAAGTKCSVISVQGYNRPCGSVNSFGTVQREVLLQL